MITNKNLKFEIQNFKLEIRNKIFKIQIFLKMKF